MESRFTHFITRYGLDLRDFTIDEDGDVILTDSGIDKLDWSRLTVGDARLIGIDPYAGYSDSPRGLE